PLSLGFAEPQTLWPVLNFRRIDCNSTTAVVRGSLLSRRAASARRQPLTDAGRRSIKLVVGARFKNRVCLNRSAKSEYNSRVAGAILEWTQIQTDAPISIGRLVL